MTHSLSLKPVLIKVVTILLLCTMLVPCAAVVVPMRAEARPANPNEEPPKGLEKKYLDFVTPIDLEKALKDKEDELHVSGLSRGLLQIASCLVGNFASVSNIFGNATMDCFSSANTSSIGSVSFDAITSLSSTIIESLKPVGYAISLCFFFIALIELAMEDRFTIELFVKFFAKFIAAYAAIYYSDKLVEEITNFGNSFAEFIAGKVSNSGTSEKTPLDTAKNFHIAMDKAIGDDGNLGIAIGIMIVSFIIVAIGIIVMLVLAAMVYWYAASRLIELCVRGCFMPIALALLSDDGWRGAGGRYARKFVAVAAQGAILVMIGKASQALIMSSIDNLASSLSGSVGQMIGGFVTSAIITIAIGLAAVKLMGQSLQIISEVFGG